MSGSKNDGPKTVEELLKANHLGLTRAQIDARCRAYKISGWLNQLKALKDSGRIKVCGRFFGARFKLVS